MLILENCKCGCNIPEPIEIINEPFHTQKSVCKHCNHLIYYQYNKWEHFTRAYKPYGYPYTTIECFAHGEV